MRKKIEIDKRVAVLTAVPQKVVRKVTTEFLEELMKQVVDCGEIALDGFGSLRLSHRKTTRNPRLLRSKNRRAVGEHTVICDTQHVVVFKKASRFKQIIWEKYGKPGVEDIMEKYAVSEEVDQESLEKKANKGCPSCGHEPEKHGSTLVCPVHGTEPFEKE